MTVEQIVRDQLERATEQVPTGPDLETAVAGGRRRRRNRRVGLATVAVAAVISAPLGVSTFLPDQPAATAHETASGAPAPAPPVVAVPAIDYVAGTDTDETLSAAVADHLDLAAADDVYPSDSVHPGPMTDADFARATDWIASYGLGRESVEVSMGYADPALLACGEGCTATPVEGGALQERSSLGWHREDADGIQIWVFDTQLVRGSFYVNVREQVPARSLAAAQDRRTLDADAVAALVTDPRLTFPRP